MRCNMIGQCQIGPNFKASPNVFVFFILSLYKVAQQVFNCKMTHFLFFKQNNYLLVVRLVWTGLNPKAFYLFKMVLNTCRVITHMGSKKISLFRSTTLFLKQVLQTPITTNNHDSSLKKKKKKKKPTVTFFFF